MNSKSISNATLYLFLLGTLASADQIVQCSGDGSMSGYDSIKKLNEDMKLLIEKNVSSNSPIEFHLCPNTQFNGSEILSPTLNNSAFICGLNGDPREECIIQGGKSQIVISDPTVTFVSFRGITLAGATEHAVLAQGPLNGTADFFECRWMGGHGISGIHIGLPSNDIEGGMEDIQSEFRRSSTSKEAMMRHAVINNLFQHRRMAEPIFGMTLRIYNSSFEDINDDGFEVISSYGNLYLFNTSFRNIEAGVLTSVKSGKAIIDSCHFKSSTVTSIIRVVSSDMVEIRGTIMEDNNATGMVTAIGSNVSIVNSQFIRNHASRGGEILAFSSNVDMEDTCIIQSTSMASVFQSSNSQVQQSNVSGSNLSGKFCPGILHEDKHSACFNGGECVGQCNHFTGDSCNWNSDSMSLTLLPTLGAIAWVMYSVLV